MNVDKMTTAEVFESISFWAYPGCDADAMTKDEFVKWVDSVCSQHWSAGYDAGDAEGWHKGYAEGYRNGFEDGQD